MLARCPVCSYQLDGLPSRHRCPECGFGYDQQMEVFEQSSVLASFFGLCIGLATVGIYFTWPFRLKGPAVVFALVGLGYMLYYVAKFLLGRRNRVVVGPEGFVLISNRRIRRAFEWSRIERVSLTSAEIAIYNKPDGTLYSLTEGYLGSGALLKRLFLSMSALHQRSNDPQLASGAGLTLPPSGEGGTA